MEEEKKAKFKESIKEAQPKLVEVEAEGVSLDSSEREDLLTLNSTEKSSVPEASAGGEFAKIASGVDLGDRYEIVDYLGEGGTGQVYKVFDKELELTLAVKVLKKEVSENPETQKRFFQEANLAMTLTHENIISMYGPGEAPDGSPFIVMDYLEGQTLDEIFSDTKTLSEERFYTIFEQVLEGLSHAHSKGLVHRDLKPENILVTQSDTGYDVVKIIDFGIVKLKETSLRTTHNITQTGEVFGTPFYMSPEQCLGLEVDERSDIYSIGCMMYEALTGNPPFEGENSVQIISKHLGHPTFPLDTDNQQLNDLVEDCLEKDSLHRPKNAISLLAKLRDCKIAKKFPVSVKIKGIQKLISSDRPDILPGYRFSYGLYKLIQFLFLIAIVPFFVLNPNEGQLIIGGYFILIVYFLFYSSNNLLIIKEASKIVLSNRGKPDSLVAFQRQYEFPFFKRSMIRFEGEKKSEKYIENKNQIEVDPLPRECERWFDAKGKALAVKIGSHFHLKNLERISLTPIQFGFFFMLTFMKAQMLFSYHHSFSSVFSLGSFVALGYMFCIGMYRAFKTKSLALGVCSIVSVPLLIFSILGTLALIFPDFDYIEILRAVPSDWVIWILFLPIIFWTVYGAFNGLTKTGIIRLSKRQ